jgi:hypothetical protein
VVKLAALYSTDYILSPSNQRFNIENVGNGTGRDKMSRRVREDEEGVADLYLDAIAVQDDCFIAS